MARKSSRIVSVGNLHDVEEGGGSSVHVPEGVYEGVIEEVTQGVSAAGNDMFIWTIKGKSGKAKNKNFKTYTTLTDDSLWKLKQYLNAMGVEIPKGAMDVDLDDLEGREVKFEVVDDEYKGKIKSTISRLINGEDDEPVDDEEEEDKPKATRKAKTATTTKKADKPSEDEVREMDEEELEGVVEKFDLDIDLSEFKTLRRKASAVVAALQE